MKPGKLPEAVLVRSVLKQVSHRRGEVLNGPGVGIDCAALELKDGEAVVLSTDPITGTTDAIGCYAIHSAANDLAASGAEPVGALLTALLPETIEEAGIRTIVQEAEAVCRELHMELLGGHTEITRAVLRPVISVTGVGKIRKADLMKPEAIRPGLDVVLTKWIGLEATAILAAEREDLLAKRFSYDFLKTAKSFRQLLSVVADARAARTSGAVYMHDVTEGGIFGALWEAAEAGHVGLEIDARSIPIRQETVEICEVFGVNPYQILSGGSLLILSENGQQTLDALADAGIPAMIVGRTTDKKDRILKNGQDIRYLDRPQPDELYRALEVEA